MGRNIWARSRGYDLGRYYVDLCTRTQFSSVRITGRENIPRSGAVILAPNHCAALMDPLLILLLRHGPIGFGARSDIFANPRVAGILNWLRILPMARERNGLREVAKNFETMEDIVDCLRHDVPFCMYSEGAHRAERGLLPIKKGVFRIARKALEDLRKPVKVIPIGVDYEYFFRIQGRVVISVGEPIDVGDYVGAHGDENDSEIYSGLCSLLRERILGLLGRVPERSHDMRFARVLLALAALPLWAVSSLLSLTIWLPSEIILSRFRDKAWTNTVYFGLRFFQPLLWPFMALSGWLNNYVRNLADDLNPERAAEIPHGTKNNQK